VQQRLTAQGDKRFSALYGVYLLQTRQIWAPALVGSDWFHLADAPPGLEGFHAIAGAVAGCDRIASVLGGATSP